ncbi:MAG: glycosyltransferase [Patescibacteria group bacterium]
MLTLSIVTKTYNRCAFLKECIDSVQLLKNEPFEKEIKWEHLIYDDGSTDGTQDFCQNLRYPNVRYLRSEINEGIARAANKAISMCDSEWIFELDSDDFVPSRILHNFYNSFLEYSETKWFVMDFYRVDASGKYEFGQDYYGWRYRAPNSILQAIFNGEHFIQHNVIYKKELWDKVGKYDESFFMAEDLDLYIRFLLRGEMPVYLPIISHFHRNHDENISREVDFEKHKADLQKLFEKYKPELRNNRINI